MVLYSDPEECHDAREPQRRKYVSPAEKIRKLQEKNAALTGVHAVEAAREVALRRLDSHAASRAQLREAILSRGFSQEIAEEVLERLESVGLIDDAAYARAVVSSAFTLNGKVGRALVEDLRRKGVDENNIASAIADISSEDQYEKACELAHKKKRTMLALDTHVAQRRLMGMLARKGYPQHIIHRVVQESLSSWTDRESEEYAYDD
ncbi:regulatory protein RecX [Schaalia sp. lx-100]|uniref:regulatory protein RecX n=1 Tax=Schaalia sp. lx-100 TaxID=2899081 RepID=UPI001E4FB366|nr:regulatory protein RecX [Schaalia sp. lx-100]MCD4557021.1 recombination regulator RecX [Schaalia sp. lx-100]